MSAGTVERRKSSMTPSDKAYGWTIGFMFGFSAYLVSSSLSRLATSSLFASLLVGVAAALIAGGAAYRWASEAKARWRQESASPEG
jgi:hypothetical protein